MLELNIPNVTLSSLKVWIQLHVIQESFGLSECCSVLSGIVFPWHNALCAFHFVMCRLMPPTSWLFYTTLQCPSKQLTSALLTVMWSFSLRPIVFYFCWVRFPNAQQLQWRQALSVQNAAVKPCQVLKVMQVFCVVNKAHIARNCAKSKVKSHHEAHNICLPITVSNVRGSSISKLTKNYFTSTMKAS